MSTSLKNGWGAKPQYNEKPIRYSNTRNYPPQFKDIQVLFFGLLGTGLFRSSNYPYGATKGDLTIFFFGGTCA